MQSIDSGADSSEASRVAENAPVFLVGSERSGTTMLRLMLDGHPSLSFEGESDYLVLRVPEVGWPDMREYRRWLETFRAFNMSEHPIDPKLEYTALVRGFLEQNRKRAGKPMVGTTVHKHFERLVRIWPRARFIHLVRDGRDVARSVVEMGWAGNVWGGVETWLEAERQWDRLRAGLGEGRYIEVRYEDLAQDARAQLARVCGFLGLRFEESMFGYAQTTTYDLPDPAFSQQWRRKMPRMDVRLIEARAGETLLARGYELSGEPPIEIGPALRSRLERENRMGRFRFRLKRYGAALLLADILTRRVGPAFLGRRVRLKMNDVEMRFLK